MTEETDITAIINNGAELQNIDSEGIEKVLARFDEIPNIINQRLNEYFTAVHLKMNEIAGVSAQVSGVSSEVAVLKKMLNDVEASNQARYESLLSQLIKANRPWWKKIFG